MTTETAAPAKGAAGPLARVLTFAAVGALAPGLLLTLIGAVTGGRPAALGALIGTLVVVGVIAFGSYSVNLVAGIMPSAALIVAVVTYAAQITTTLVVLRLLDRSGWVNDGTISGGWVAAGVVLAVLAWTAAHIVAFRRARIPVYELPEAGAR